MSYIICGCPRSGTTILSDYICKTDNIMCFHELGNYIWGNEFELRYNEYADFSAKKNNIKIPIYDVDISEPAKICEKIEEKYGYICGDKLPDYCLYDNMKVIVNNNPDIKVIFLIRNVHSFISSSLRHYQLGFNKHWCFSLQHHAENFWCLYNSNIIKSLELLKDKNYTIIRYENLVSNTQQEISKIDELLNTKINHIDNIIYDMHTDNRYNLQNKTKCLMEFMGYKGFDY